MNKDTVYLLGCSFTDAVKHFNGEFFRKFKDSYNIINLGYISRSNFQILEDIKTLPKNSIAIIQWSSLSRPNGIPDYDIDWNAELNELAYSSNDPLQFFISNFIKVLTTANSILKEKNIKSFQYIGWVQWTDAEIDYETSKLLNNLNINWFSTPSLIDVIPCNCWECNPNTVSNKIRSLLGFHKNIEWEWKSTKWGGMSEWIRLNVDDMYKRYIAITKRDGYNDAHPTEYASEQFYKNVIVVEIEKMLQTN
jgi:hypothetical protein